MERGIFKVFPSSPKSSAPDLRHPETKTWSWAICRESEGPEAPEPLTAAPFKDSSVLALLQVWCGESLCHCLWSGLKNYTWVFCQEVDSLTMPRKTRKSRGKGSNESRAKSLITTEVLVKHLRHISFLHVFFFFNFILFLNFTILYWFCQIPKWIRHRYTCVPHPEPSSLLPPHTIPLGHPSAPAPSIQYRASNLDWWLVPYMILYVFQCHSPKSSYPLPLPQSPKDCSIHQCLFCCFVHRVIVTIFL